jgi:alcohol dehydrogenase (cytochrome c)
MSAGEPSVDDRGRCPRRILRRAILKLGLGGVCLSAVSPVIVLGQNDPAHKPGVGKTVDICPMYLGGKNWQPAAFNPKTRLIYIPTSANLCSSMTGAKPEYRAGSTYTGGRSTLFIAPNADHLGETAAWNVDTAKKVWSYNFPKSSNWGGLLTTGSGLVFGGGTADRFFRALDASTGQLLWQTPTNSGVMGQPSTFTVNGKQYIAVMSGWGGDARGVQAQLNRLRPGEFPEVPDGGALWVFTLSAER